MAKKHPSIRKMLNNISSDIDRFCRVMSSVVGVNMEIVDLNMIRWAGTGIYADGFGESIGPADAVYQNALSSGRTVLVENPREHELCGPCSKKNDCFEQLNLCTPIVLGGETLGIIGLVCFSPEEKEKVFSQKLSFIAFLEQLASDVAAKVEANRRSVKTRRTLDALLEATNGNTNGLMLISANGSATYQNRAAREEFSRLAPDLVGLPVAVKATGNKLNDLTEYEVEARGETKIVFGRLISLASTDDDFSQALLTEPMPRLQMISQTLGADAGRSALSSIIGVSSVIRALRERVRQIAKTSSTVLITGESGTGKEMFARAIHDESARRDKPFVAINCGAIPESLLESELFGYVRGAFTGANSSGRMGKFELADSGVIFLDEISSMSLFLQAKLLRVLQEKRFTRLGDNRLISVDVRVLAATNDDLPNLIAQRMFREDLFYRLNVIPMELPPLRQRREDIPVLAEFFLDHYCRRFEKPPARLTPAILSMFMVYDWPGNIREFENCIEFMVNMHEWGPLNESSVPRKIIQAWAAANGDNAQDLSLAAPGSDVLAPRKKRPEGESRRGVPTERLSSDLLQDSRPTSQAPGGGSVRVSSNIGSKASGQAVVPLSEVEEQAIRRALEHFSGQKESKKKAARALGISLATLYRKISS
ncbi:MAG: sigma 54-interacting transcriptional regulator [Deltaproteobacteria bacterium]|jgi:transcriptional regulator with PAS, ATPase and Fis domain|nr:sigma 54-interacting transcriptional regulator [Deltaproteobacteria bacterium]